MNTINQMKNIIVLKDLPSNIIEEAFVILKPNKKVKINNQEENKNLTETTSEYIVKEAEMVITNYISDVENESKIRSRAIKQIEDKYKRLRKVTLVLSIACIISIFLGFFIG